MAVKLVKHARQVYQIKHKETWDQTHARVEFEPGSLVRFYNRVPARKGEDPPKVKLRNAVYEVVRMQGTRVELKDRITAAPRDAHVTQLALFKEPAAAVPLPIVGGSNATPAAYGKL